MLPEKGYCNEIKSKDHKKWLLRYRIARIIAVISCFTTILNFQFNIKGKGTKILNGNSEQIKISDKKKYVGTRAEL